MSFLITAPPILVTAQQAAELTGVGVARIRAAEHSNHLPARYPDANPRYKIEDLLEWVNNLPTEKPSRR
ncbi:helix-turn-helix domain-containing protein [Dermabacteraceae bacterium TAE3-ERU27]|nr:helix-turn-helix domain-containing protein [Dermabacteraceae bacterium TAE3-ERU27]